MNMDQQLSNNIHSHISIDGLVIAKFSRSVFKEMQHGKITAANCTCSVWENFNETISKLTVWNDHFKKNDYSDFQFISSWEKNYKSCSQYKKYRSYCNYREIC